ncbi:MAG: ATP-binding protein [Pseudomonadota bacterium]
MTQKTIQVPKPLSDQTPTGGFPAGGIGPDILRHLADAKPDLLVAAIEACPVNITIADMLRPDAPLAYVNPAFTETTGYALDDVVGRNCRFLQGEHTDPEAVAALRQAIEQETSIELDLLNYRKDGTPFDNHLKMAPVHDWSGRLVAYVGIQSDVTAERLRERAEIDRQRLEALGQMAGGVAHQLNNLLQPILSLVSLNQSDMKDSRMAADFDVVLQSARQAADVVRDTLAFSKGDSRTYVNVPIGEVVESQVAFIRTLLPADVRVDLKIEESAGANTVRIDVTQFSQVLANLMINSAQAMQASGNIDVFVSFLRPGHVTIAVSDEGPGIPAEHRARVLEPFYTTRSEAGGTGLGLSVVYGIVKRLGGTLAIETAGKDVPGGGCLVTLTLPIAS